MRGNMTMDWIMGSLFLGTPLVLSVSVLLIWFGMSSETREKKNRELFSQDLAAAVKHSQPTWEQVLDMAELNGVSSKTAYDTSRALLRDLLTGKDTDLEKHKNLIETYIARHKMAEPFEGLPTETRVHFERLREALSGKEQLLEPLTMQVRELVSVYEKDKKAQRRYTAWGFFVGVLGILFAAYTYIHPLINPVMPPPPNRSLRSG
jgi:hypothetical protein